MEELGEGEVDLSSSFLSPYPMGDLKGWHLRLSVCASIFFVKLGAEWDYPTALCGCSLSRLWVGREASWSCGHKVSLVKICLVETNGVNRNEGHLHNAKEHKHLHSYLFPSN